MGLRRLRALVGGLPLDSAVVRAVAPHAEWRAVEELLATLIEVVDQGNRWFFEANSKRGAPRPKPIKVPRPDRGEPSPATNGAGGARPSRRRRPATSTEMRRFFGGTVRYVPRGG